MNQNIGDVVAGGYSLDVSAAFGRMAREAGVQDDLTVSREHWQNPEITERLWSAAVAGGGMAVRAEGADLPFNTAEGSE